MKHFFFILLFPCTILSQTNLHSSENIRLFADYLYCEKDYLRAAEEYEKIPDVFINDTVQFKIGLSYLQAGDISKASEQMHTIYSGSPFYKNSLEELIRIKFVSKESLILDSSATQSMIKLKVYSDLMIKEELPSVSDFSTFREEEKSTALKFYNRKKELPYKSETLAGILSALIPGAGKIYTGNYSDGITSFLVTTVLGYLTYSNFRADHQFRGYLFSGLTFFFYGGNIYGSAANAQIYNEQVKLQYNQDLNEYLKEKNYFMKHYDFCN